MYELFWGEPEEDQGEIIKEWKHVLYTEAVLDKQILKEIIYYLEEYEGDSHPLKKKYLHASEFKDWKEADNFAKRCGGRCLGKEKVEAWVLEIDPVKFKKLRKDKQ